MIKINDRSKADAMIGELSEAYARRVEAMPPGTCPIAVQIGLLETCAAQTCGKCTPCREGIPRIKELLEEVVSYRADEGTIEEIAKRARLLRDSAAIRSSRAWKPSSSSTDAIWSWESATPIPGRASLASPSALRTSMCPLISLWSKRATAQVR